jgi:hypothetical protein
LWQVMQLPLVIAIMAVSRFFQKVDVWFSRWLIQLDEFHSWKFIN